MLEFSAIGVCEVGIMKYLFFCESENSGGVLRGDGTSEVSYTASLNYAVILWRRGALSVVEASDLSFLDLSQGLFSELPSAIQQKVVSVLNEVRGEKDLVIRAHKLLPYRKKHYAKDSNAELQSSYMKYVAKVQKYALSSDYYPLIKPAGYGFDITYKELELTADTMQDVPLETLYKVMASEYTFEKIRSLFASEYDLLCLPDRVLSFSPTSSLDVSARFEKNDYPSKKALTKLLVDQFEGGQGGFWSKASSYCLSLRMRYSDGGVSKSYN